MMNMIGVGQITEGQYSCTCMETDYAEYSVTVKKIDAVLHVVDRDIGIVTLAEYESSLTDLTMFRIG